MTRPASSGLRRSPTSTAADVSSHDVSMPRTTSATSRLPPERHRIGDGAGNEARRPAHREPGVVAWPRLPDQVRDDELDVSRERVDAGSRDALRQRHTFGRLTEAGEASRRCTHRY